MFIVIVFFKNQNTDIYKTTTVLELKQLFAHKNP